MPFNGSGVFSAYTPGNPVADGTNITAAWGNATIGDIATNGLTNCITKDGQTATTASIPFAEGIALASTKRLYLDGVGATGDTYIYESAANTLGLVVGGTTALSLTTVATLGMNVALGAFYISRAGTAAGLSLDASNNATLSGTLAMSSLITVTLASDGYGIKTVKSGGATVGLYADTTTGYVGTPAGIPLALFANGGAANLTISTAGNTTLSGTLTVSGASITGSGTYIALTRNDPNAIITITNAQSSKEWWFGVAGTGSSLGSSGSFGIRNQTNSILALEISATGNTTLSGTLTVSGTGPHAIGGATTSGVALRLTGSLASSDRSFLLDTTLSPPAGAGGVGISVTPTFNEAGSSTHPHISAIYIAPTIVAGAATVTTAAGINIQTFAAQTTTTNAAGIYIDSAPTGATNNYALWAAGGSFRFDGAGPHAIGGATEAAIQLKMLGTFTSSSTGIGLALRQRIQPAANGSGYLFETGGTIDKAGSGNHDNFCSLYIQPATVTAGSATVTNCATVKITGAMSGGSNNYAFWVSAGDVRMDSVVYMNDTSNANSTLGLTINQAGNDDEILSFKSSDVAHGMTAVSEADTYARFKKYNATAGGMIFSAITTGSAACEFQGCVTTTDTTKSTAGAGAVEFTCATKSGTGISTNGANSNMAAFKDYSSTRFILDSDGDSHQDVGTAWTNFDAHDDLMVMDAMAIALNRGDPLRNAFVASLEESRTVLDKLPGKPIVTFNEDGHHFANMSRVTMLHHGAIRQLGRQMQELASENAALKAKVALLEHRL